MKKEWFLTALIVLYLVLFAIDHSLPKKSLELIDYESLAVIVSLFIVSRGLELSGFFGRVAPRIISISGGSETRLLILITLVVAASSAVIMNDTAMFIFVPLVLTMSRMADLDVAKTVTFVAIAANVGSSLTPIGNPQNIIIWRTYHVKFPWFIASMLPYVVIWLLVLALFVWVTSRGKKVEIAPIPKIRIKRSLLGTSIALLVADVVLAELGHPFVALFLTLVVMLIVGKEAVFSLDVALIAIFALIFIDFKELASLLSIGALVSQLSVADLAVLSALVSQVVSNVPATVMLVAVKPPWEPIAVGVNVGGTGFIIGSLANFIAVRLSGIDIKSFHKKSIPYFVVTTILSILILSL